MKYFIFALLVGASFAFADDGPANPRLTALCQNPAVEGRYNGGQFKGDPVTIYIVCTGEDRIEASWVMPHSQTAIALPFVAVDGDQLTFASFSLAYDDAGEVASNSSPAIRLEASLSTLKNGILEADYKTAHNLLPLHVHAHRDQTFVNLLRDVRGLTPHGTFRLENSTVGLLPFKAPTYIDLDVVNGIERVTLADSNSIYYTLYLGMLAEDHGSVIYASSGIGDDDQSAMMPQIQIRGHLIGADIFEFYYFNTMYGMSGPYRAQRVHP